MVIETLHTVGLMILMFRCLPLLDGTRAVLVMAGVGLLPSILRVLIRQPTGYVVMDIVAIVIQLSALLFYPVFTSISPVTKDPDCTEPSIVGKLPEMVADFWPLSIALFFITITAVIINQENCKKCPRRK